MGHPPNQLHRSSINVPVKLWVAVSNYYYGASEESAKVLGDRMEELCEGATIEVEVVQWRVMTTAFFTEEARHFTPSDPDDPKSEGVEDVGLGLLYDEDVSVASGPDFWQPQGRAKRKREEHVTEQQDVSGSSDTTEE